MLELAHKLADCDSSFFGGWVMAGCRAFIDGAAAAFSVDTHLPRPRRAVVTVQGLDAGGRLRKSLTVHLLLPRERLAVKPDNVADEATGALTAVHTFTKEEVEAYIAASGDENIIHKGDTPIVPGLCMAAWLQGYLKLDRLDWDIRFLSIVRTGDELTVYHEVDMLTGWVGRRRAFVIKTNEF